MIIRIERGSSVPVSRQIADQVRAQCASGVLRPGDRLPSVRQLAQELAVNQNTVLRVYELLTGEGLIERRHGEGTFVRQRQPAGRMPAQRKRFEEELAGLTRRGLMLGLDPHELHEMLDAALERAGIDDVKQESKP